MENQITENTVSEKPDTDFTLAGVMAIAQTILFPAAFIVGIILSPHAFLGRGHGIDPFNFSDVLFLANTGIGVYVMLMFRKLLNQRHDYSGIDILIYMSIIWLVVFQVGMLLVQGYFLSNEWLDERIYAVVQGFFVAFFFVFIGVVDILIGVRLLKARDQLNDILVVFAYVNLVAGICECTVILSFLALFIIPVNTAVLAAVFLRKRDDLKFV